MAFLAQVVEDPNWPWRRHLSPVSGEGRAADAVTLMVSFFKTLSIVYALFLFYCAARINNRSRPAESQAPKLIRFAGEPLPGALIGRSVLLGGQQPGSRGVCRINQQEFVSFSELIRSSNKCFSNANVFLLLRSFTVDLSWSTGRERCVFLSCWGAGKGLMERRGWVLFLSLPLFLCLIDWPTDRLIDWLVD